MCVGFYPGIHGGTLPPYPPTAGKQTGNKKGLNAAVWAVPVAIVGLIFIIILAYFIINLVDWSALCSLLSNMRSSRDDDGGVTFHSEEEVPFIQGFSDDEPLGKRRKPLVSGLDLSRLCIVL
ncbi:protein tyrosine phosphatase [Desmophyllum pertusum]|uniref:Protein tyrosine phosphatase n=1 Tax=Desmophyllum pertusum TaxID=174260 RepID=A0A9W9ZMR0_9CNID|nr:protein tyrosine phosphatase [Desmophyllum pertusum]